MRQAVHAPELSQVDLDHRPAFFDMIIGETASEDIGAFADREVRSMSGNGISVEVMGGVFMCVLGSITVHRQASTGATTVVVWTVTLDA